MFRCGEAKRVGGLKASIWSYSFLSVQNRQRQPQAWSVLQWHGVSVWRSQTCRRLEGSNLDLVSCLLLGRGSCRPKARSTLQWHGVSVWRSQRFGGLKAPIWASFLSVQKATLGRGSRRPGPSFSGMVLRCDAGRGSRKARSVLPWHGASVWQRQPSGGLKAPIRSLFLVNSESDVRQRQPQAEGQVCPSVAWCFKSGDASPVCGVYLAATLALGTRGKKDAKIIRCLWESILDRFWAFF